MEVSKKEKRKYSHVNVWVANRVRELRLQSGYTQAKIGERMGIHCSRVSDLEHNRDDFKFSTIVRFCWAVGIGVEDFFKGVPSVRTEDLDKSAKAKV